MLMVLRRSGADLRAEPHLFDATLVPIRSTLTLGIIFVEKHEASTRR